MRHYNVLGIVIKRRNVGEADRILTVFSQKNGKMQLRAPGVRKLTSRRASHIELCNLSTFTLYKGRSLPIVTEAQTIHDFSKLKEDLTKIGFAYHLCELIDGLCPENQENFAVFVLLKETLTRLANGGDIVSVIHEFEIELLTLLGFWPKNRSSQHVNTHRFIENILERRLRSKVILSRLS